MMANSEERGIGAEEEEEKLLEGVRVLDFDMLCATVAMQTQGKWTKLNEFEDIGEEKEQEGEIGGGVMRMWEGEVLDCLDNRPIALQSVCCPCYRFGKNMGRAGFGPCFVQGTIYILLVATALVNFIAFIVTEKHYFLYLGLAFSILVATYLGYYRSQIRKNFNIRDSDSMLDDCVFHLVCPCCTLSQESRTLEMNNIQDGMWHGRGDTICIGAYREGNKTFFELQAPPVMSINPPIEHGNVQVAVNVADGLCASPIFPNSIIHV